MRAQFSIRRRDNHALGVTLGRYTKRLSRVRVASKASLRYALCIFNKVSNFAFDVCKLTYVGVKINHLLFIAEDMTMCIKLQNCDILYQFHL